MLNCAFIYFSTTWLYEIQQVNVYLYSLPANLCSDLSLMYQYRGTIYYGCPKKKFNASHSALISVLIALKASVLS